MAEQQTLALIPGVVPIEHTNHQGIIALSQSWEYVFKSFWVVEIG